MKKYILQLVVCITTAAIFSCNGGNKSNNPPDNTDKAASDTPAITKFNVEWFNKDNVKICEEAGGLANFFVPRQEGSDMMTDFNSIYRVLNGKTIEALENSYWLSACQIAEMITYLDKEKNDGIRIYMACSLNADPVRYKDQEYQNKTNIFIFPTKFDNTIPPAGSKSQHVTYEASKLHLETCAATSDYFKDYTSVAKPMIQKFESLYRLNPKPGEDPNKKDALSLSVWIDKCVIRGLHELLKANPLTNDGAFINLGAYKTKIPTRTRFQKHDKQSTMLIIPTKPNGAGHLPDWSLLEQAEKAFKQFAPPPPGGFNHGELCPQVCN